MKYKGVVDGDPSAPPSDAERGVGIVMELVPGGSIRTVLERFGPLDEEVIRAYARQILRGLHFLHRRR